MPTINRFRVVNFKYDNDKKYIGDMLLELHGQNSLMNLENGGGKSVILQLALQVLMPNCELSNRKFVDYFKINSGTAHILIEWLLDTTVPEYLLTGICATRDSEGLKFFTYTHAYSKQNECDIKRIPVVNSKKQVTTYSEFYKFLRSMTSEFRINTYSKDRMRDYREKLASSNLFENEFEAVKIINQSEGGIEKFFERARKSRNVIERLIIPAIPSLGGEEQSLLTGTFKKHFENLKNIPALQYNLQIYESFMTKGAELLELLEQYQNLTLDCSQFKTEILILENIVYVVTKRLLEEAKSYGTQIEDLEIIEQELNYKKDSLEIFMENKEIQTLEQRRAFKVNALEVEHQRLHATENKLKYMISANAYLDLKEQQSKHMEFNEKLKLLELEENEVQQEFQDCLFSLSGLLDKEIERIKAMMEEYIQKSEVASEKLEESRTQKRGILEEKQRLSSNLAVNNSNKERFEEEHKQHSESFTSRDIMLLLDPESALLTFEEGLEETKKSKQELSNNMLQLAEKEEDITIRLHNLNLEKKTLEERLSTKKETQLSYDKKLINLEEQLVALGIETDIYSGSVEEKLLMLVDKTAANLAAAQVNYNAVENKKLLLDELDYFLPDKDVLKVYKFLEENSVKSMPGSLWLKNQPKGQREELLQNNPLLPFSIIVSSAQLERVESLSESMAKLAEDYPVAIITADSAGLYYISDNISDAEESHQSHGSLDPLKGSQVFILRSGNNRFLIHDGELEEYVKSLAKRLEKNRNEIDVLKFDQDKIISIKERTADFLREYGLSWKSALQKDIKDITEKIGFLEKEEGRICDEHKKIKGDLFNTRETIQKKDQLITETIKDIEEMKGLIKAQKAILDCESNIKQLTPLLNNLTGQEALVEKEIDNFSAIMREAEDKSKEMEREVRRLSGRISEVKKELIINNPSKVVPGNIDELEAKLQAQKGKLSSGSRDSILASVRAIETVLESFRKTIKSKGYSEQDFEGVYERVQDSEILKAEESEKEIKATVIQLENEGRKIEGEISKLRGYKEAHIQALDKKYGSTPYEFQAGEPLEFQFYDEQIKAAKNKKNKLDTKLKEITIHKNEVDKQLGLIKQFIEDREIKMPEETSGEMLQLKGFEETIGLWDIMKMKSGEMAVLFKRYKQAFDEIDKKTENGRNAVEECFNSLYKNDTWMENLTLKSVLSGIMKENLFNVKYMQELFTRLFESVGKMKDAAALQLEECKRNKGELVERCLQRAKTVYEEVKLVDSFSKLKVNGENRKVVKIEMPKLDEEQGRSLMALYLEKCIEELGKQKEQGSYDPLKIDNTISGYMTPQALLDAVINLNDISIQVFKPEHNLELSQYVPWEVVIQWSGGEKLAGFFAMFISIISYLRYKRTGGLGSSKVIWIDNPFGQANAGHLLGYIFELAKATNTQMICLTGLQETTIYAQFDVVYSLVHRMLSSMSIIQTKQVKADQSIEVGYYNLKDSQMSFL